MEFEQWQRTYTVGDPLMDAYHHIFFQTLEDLAAAIDTITPEAVADRIAFLSNYAEMHFQSEERLMAEHGFPELEGHAREHQAFRDRLSAFRQSYLAAPSPAAARQLLQMIQDWLAHHILEEDMKYRPYLKQEAGA